MFVPLAFESLGRLDKAAILEVKRLGAYCGKHRWAKEDLAPCHIMKDFFFFFHCSAINCNALLSNIYFVKIPTKMG